MSIDVPHLDQAPRQPRENQFRFLLNALLEHKIMIVSAAVIGCLLFGGVSWLRLEIAAPRYGTHADVVITPSHWEKDILKDVGGGALFPVTPRALVERTSRRGLAQEIARSLVQRAIADGGQLGYLSTGDELKGKADAIEPKLQLVPLDDSHTIRIEVNDCLSGAEAEAIAETAARVFLEQNRQVRLEEGQQTHEFIKKKLAELQQQLFEAESAEWEYKHKMGFQSYGKVDEDMTAMYEELKELNATRGEIEAKLAELEAELALNSDQLPESLGQVTDSVVNKLFVELDELLQQQLSMSAVYQPTFPDLIELEEEIAEKQLTILEALKLYDTGVAGGSSVWHKRQEIYRQQMDLRMRLTGSEIRASAIKRMLEDMIPQIPELANKNLEYEKLVQETNSIREQFNRLSKREWDIRTALSQGSGQVERYEPVKKALAMPIGMGRPSIWVNFVIGAFAGFICAFCIAMMMEANDTSIRSIEDVNEYIGLEVIGTIPKMRFGKPRGGRRRRATYVTTVDEEQIDACIVTQHDPKSPISEAYRTLRTNFQFASINLKPRTVMVTSAVPGEGKTTTAANMAVTMADRGIRVLIVDTDLRRPNVHRVLRMERGPGLADVLREGLEPKSVIRPTRIENLWIISSGRVPPNPSELIGSQRMARLMEQLGEDFDLVICDAPSVLVVTDPVLLATHVDTAVMVVSTNNARRETVIRANKLLEAANVNIAGVVVNGLETTRRHYYYYYYYYDDGAPVRRKWYHFY